MPPENDTSLRDTLESAFNASEQSEAGRPAADSPEPVRTAPETPAAVAKPAEGAPAPDDRGDGRRPDGKFARKVPAPAAPADGAARAADAGAAPVAGAPAQPAPVADQFGKAPASWKPGAREAWGHLPAEVRAEVHRREIETARTLQQTAQAREIASTAQQLQHEFGPALAAEGVDLITATRNLMQISSRLRFGTPQDKAVTVAQIMQAYGVDVPTLDAILSNSPMPQQAQQQAQQLRDPRVDGLLSELAAVRQQAAQRVQSQAVAEVGNFGQDKDFFNDVREVMADLMEVAARRGIDLSLDQAYERACQMDPEISRVLAQRAAAGSAQNQQRSTARNRNAASSVRSTPAVGGAPAKPENLRGALEAAWDSAASG